MQMQELTDLLHKENHTLVVENAGEVRTFDGRGVRNLYELLRDDPAFLRGASVADKVVGKGAASLMIFGGVRRLHTDVVSRSALDLLRKSDIEFLFANEVPHIANRAGNGLCPVEILCSACASAEECLPLIADFVENNSEKK